MDTQRDLDETAISQAEIADTRLRALLVRSRELFTSRPEAQAALDAAQDAFESYRASQLELITATTDGTIAPLLRSAAYYQLTIDREANLRRYLVDVMPDEVIPDSQCK